MAPQHIRDSPAAEGLTPCIDEQLRRRDGSAHRQPGAECRGSSLPPFSWKWSFSRSRPVTFNGLVRILGETAVSLAPAANPVNRGRPTLLYRGGEECNLPGFILNCCA